MALLYIAGYDLSIGEPLRAGILPAPAVQPCFKGGGVRVRIGQRVIAGICHAPRC